MQELELAQLEVQEYLQSKAYLAYRGLCLWQEHAGKSANRIKLIHALRQCGLYRAEGGLIFNRSEILHLIGLIVIARLSVYNTGIDIFLNIKW